MNIKTYTVIHARNPFNPLSGRSVSTRTRRVRLSGLAPSTHLPFLCLVNGAPVLRAGWDRRPGYGDIVTFVTLPQGGGGGSNPVGTVLMLAVMVYAPQLAAMYPGFSGMGVLGQGLVKMGVMMGGMALVNALVPPPRPPSPHRSAALAAPSPTYTLAAQGNSARLGAAIPVQYGRHIAYPDFAADPYAEFAGNEQFLYQLFVVGQGEYDIEAVRIEDTPVASFEEITYEVVQPGGAVTLFPSNVATSVEVAGQEALTGVYLGPFVANAAGTGANFIGVDVVCPKGLYYANDAGGLDSLSVVFTVEAQAVDNNGAPLGGWTLLGTETVTAATNTAQRKSFRYAVAAARYQVRLQRTDTKNASARAGHDLNWAGLRAYLPGSQQYGNLTVIAMRMKASNSLSAQASRKVNVVATRKLPAWHPSTGWGAAAPTRSIAWAFADACRADYGAKLADAQIPLAQLYALDAVWAARVDYFDGRFDSTMTVWEALTQIARAGRAKCYQQGGVVQIVRDQAQSVPVALFSPRNTARGSLKMDYLMPSAETADAVTVEYFDAATWKPAEVTAQLSGSAGIKPAKVQLFGCTGRDQAWREGMYMAACNRYRRKPISFSTEMEGFIPTFGDLVAISSDRLTRAQAGEVTGWDAGTRTLTLSEPLTWTAGQTHFFGLRKRDGSFSGPWAATQGADAYRAVLGAPPDITPYTGLAEERTYFTFGIGTAYRQLALVTAVKPRGSNAVELSLVNEDALVHTADQSAPPAAPAAWLLPKNPTVPAVAGLNVVQGGAPDQPVLAVSWQPAAGADHYLVEQSADGVAWTRAGDTAASNLSFPVQPGTIQIRVAGIGLTRGAWAYWNGSAGAALAPPPDVTGLALADAFTGDVCNIKWDAAARATGYTVEVWASSTLRRSRAVTGTSFSYYAADARADGGPWRNLTFRVRANGTGTTSANWASLDAGNAQIGALNNVVVTGLLASLMVEFQRPAEADFAGVRVWVSTANGFTPDATNLKYEGPNNLINLDFDPGSVLRYIRIAGYDQWGTDNLVVSAQYVASTTLVTVGQFAAGIEPVTLVTAVPLVKATNTIFNTSDGKLYRWDGAAYVLPAASVSAPDITGQIVGTQISNGAISTPKLAAGAVTTANLAVGAVTANELSANAVTAGKIAAGAVAANELAAGAVTVGKIDAGAVTANELAAGAVTALKISVATLAAINANMGSITAGDITLNTSGFIKGGQTAYNTGVGFFLGYSGGAYKFSIGNPSGSYMTWDGTALTVGGAIISTANLAPNAVSNSVGLSSTTNMAFAAGAWTTVLSQAITASGGKLSVSVSARAYNLPNGWGFRIMRDAVQLYTSTVVDGPTTYFIANSQGSVAATVIDAPAAGTYTYKLELYMNTGAGGGMVGGRALTITELKR